MCVCVWGQGGVRETGSCVVLYIAVRIVLERSVIVCCCKLC